MLSVKHKALHWLNLCFWIFFFFFLYLLSPSFLAAVPSGFLAGWRRYRRLRFPSRLPAWSPGWSRVEGASPARRWWSTRPFVRPTSSTLQLSPEKKNKNKNMGRCDQYGNNSNAFYMLFVYCYLHWKRANSVSTQPLTAQQGADHNIGRKGSNGKFLTCLAACYWAHWCQNI